MSVVQTVQKPILLMLAAYDARKTPSGGVAVTKSVKQYTGYISNKSSTTTTENSWKVGVEISGTYGFSKISSISAKVSTEFGGTTTNSTTDSSTFTTSTETEVTYTFC